MGSADRSTPLTPIDGARLAADLRRSPLWEWPDPEVVAVTGSTNADLAERILGHGAAVPEGTTLIAEEQTAGRGRLDRTWDSPRGAGLWMSLVLRPPDIPVTEWTWLPLLVGVAVSAAVQRVGDPGIGADVGLKWPNDLLLDDHKIGGILLERHGEAAVVGVGIDVHQSSEQMRSYAAAGGTAATSLQAGGIDVDRTDLAVEVLRAIAAEYLAWVAAGGDARRSGTAERYRRACRTLGWPVRVTRAGDDLEGTAIDVDERGQLLVLTGTRTVAIAAGDVTRLRPIEP